MCVLYEPGKVDMSLLHCGTNINCSSECHGIDFPMEKRDINSSHFLFECSADDLPSSVAPAPSLRVSITQTLCLPPVATSVTSSMTVVGFSTSYPSMLLATVPGPSSPMLRLTTSAPVVSTTSTISISASLLSPVSIQQPLQHPHLLQVCQMSSFFFIK